MLLLLRYFYFFITLQSVLGFTVITEAAGSLFKESPVLLQHSGVKTSHAGSGGGLMGVENLPG